MWDLAKKMFAFQWGSGTIGMGGEFRYDMAVRVLDHPVTANPGSGSPGDGLNGAVLAFTFYNCWTGSVGFNNLDSMGNSILIHQMTVHHEGFDVLWGNGRQGRGEHPYVSRLVAQQHNRRTAS